MFKAYSSFVLVIACAACGSSFSSGDGGSAGSSQAGESNGGQPSSAGSGGDAGELATGGTSSAGDGGSIAGSDSAGNGGAAVAGSAGSAGSSSGECARLKAQFQAALEKARACDKGSKDQCSPSSTVEPLACGCAVLVNAKSEFSTAAKKARQAYQDAKCGEGVACAAIACAPIVDASCAPEVGSTSAFVCSAVTTISN